MKKIGIIDNYISNFHSNTYYTLFEKIANEEGLEPCVITHIYAVTEVSPSTKETTDEWCARTGAKRCDTIEEVCESVDAIMVLAPNNPELHPELTKAPLASGKPVYVDKTFAPDYKTAREIADYGKANGANFWSSSAVRFDPVMEEYLNNPESLVKSAVVAGPNVFEIYSIHLIELINTVMKAGAKTVQCLSGGKNLIFKLDFKDGRSAFYHQLIRANMPFTLFLDTEAERGVKLECGEAFWRGFARALMEYFYTGTPVIDIESTVECIAVRTAMMKAMENVGAVIEVEGA